MHINVTSCKWIMFKVDNNKTLKYIYIISFPYKIIKILTMQTFLIDNFCDDLY